MKAYKEIVRKYYKYQYTSWTRPNLTADGTLGGDSFACAGGNANPYLAFDGNTSTYLQIFTNDENTKTLYFYNPNPLKITSLTFTYYSGTQIQEATIYGSNDYSNWDEIISYTNNTNPNTVTFPNNTLPYKYYKLYVTKAAGSAGYSGYILSDINEITFNAQERTAVESTSSDYDFYEDVSTYKIDKDIIRTYYKRTTFTSDSTFTVPSGVTKLKIDCVGAKGYTAVSGSYTGNGGNGGRVQCDLAVSAGQVLNVTVGAVPTTTSQSYNASDIRIGGNTLNDRVIVAGGGGSGVYKQDPRGVTPGAANGGAGGGLVGGNGGNAGADRTGQGGTQSGGGLGAYSSYPYHPFTAGNGEFGLGGTGNQNQGGIAGAGGAGWYGGGGAGCNGIFISAGYSSTGAAGGGGSSYTNSSCTNVIHTQGYRNGAGYVYIDYLSTSSDYDYYVDEVIYKAFNI